MSKDKEIYLTRPTSEMRTSVYRGCIEAEGTMLHVEGEGISEGVDLTRSPVATVEQRANAMNDARGDESLTYAPSTHFGWVKSGAKFRASNRSLLDLQRLAPLSNSILDVDSGGGPAERLFLALDAFASVNFEQEGTRDELVRLGLPLAARVAIDVWHAWGKNCRVTGRALPPQLISAGDDWSPQQIATMVEVAAGNFALPEALATNAQARRAIGAVVDHSAIDTHVPENSGLWILEHLLAFRNLFPDVPVPPHFGLDLFALAVASRVTGMPWSDAGATEKPRAALLSDLYWQIVFPLPELDLTVENVQYFVRMYELVRPGGDATAVAQALLDASNAAFRWLGRYGIGTEDVKILVSDAITRQKQPSPENEAFPVKLVLS